MASYEELFTEIENRFEKNKKLVIGIDGNSAAGKTTFAGLLKEKYGCEVISMDEFFLPAKLRTKERLGEPDGNVHYERFEQEAVKGILSRQGFDYRVFSCHEMDYVGTKHIENNRMLVVEGCYSMRKDFRGIYDLSIFMGISKKEQKERILKRNGEEGWRLFSEKWIPMENRYFEECRIEECCDRTFYVAADNLSL